MLFVKGCQGVLDRNGPSPDSPLEALMDVSHKNGIVTTSIFVQLVRTCSYERFHKIYVSVIGNYLWNKLVIHRPACPSFGDISAKVQTVKQV